MILDLLHQILPPAHRNGGGGSFQLLFTSTSSLPTRASLVASGGKGNSTSLRKGLVWVFKKQRNKKQRNKKQRNKNKALAWHPGLPARPLAKREQEQDNLREVRRQTHSLLHNLWFIYETFRISSILWCFNTFSVSTPWMMQHKEQDCRTMQEFFLQTMHLEIWRTMCVS